LSISCYGRDPQLLRDLVEDAVAMHRSSTMHRVSVYRRQNRAPSWIHASDIPPRSLDTVDMDQNLRDEILDDLNTFLLSRVWYLSRAVPYRRSYMFEGPPGTGKSSLVHALASFFHLPIYIFNIRGKAISEDSLAMLFDDLPVYCLLLLEDIDAAGLGSRHINNAMSPEDPPSAAGESEDGACLTLAGLLNLLDGVAAVEGRVVVMTSNCIDKLDPALIRPGRIDKVISFCLATDAQAAAIFRRLYKDDPQATAELAEEFGRRFGSKVFSPAAIQSYILKRMGEPEKALQEADNWIKE
ncbi:P-loop containing nucleoside triphosphate hydrolase protein, partial [Cryphonectria parasitica EP155]